MPIRRRRFGGGRRRLGRRGRRIVRRGRRVFRRIRGKGGYFSDAAIGRVFGRGDYKVKYNSLQAMPMGAPVPSFGDMKDATRVCHREYICDITANGTPFTLQSFSVNAGLATTFPWLSQLGVNYDQYRFRGLNFDYITSSADSTTLLSLGQVIMASDYDTVDSPFGSKLEMENSQYCVSGKPSVSITHPIECDPSVTTIPIQYIRVGGVPTGKDQRLYDLCNFQIATQGLPVSTGVIGELWATYECLFYKPQLHSGVVGGAVLTDHFILSAANISTTNYFGLTPLLQTGSLINGVITAATNTYTFPASVSTGLYLLVYVVFGASTTLTNFVSFSTFINAGVVAYMNNDTTSVARLPAGAVSTQQIFVQTIRVTGTSASFQVVAGTLPGTITGGDFWVTQLNSSIVS